MADLVGYNMDQSMLGGAGEAPSGERRCLRLCGEGKAEKGKDGTNHVAELADGGGPVKGRRNLSQREPC